MDALVMDALVMVVSLVQKTLSHVTDVEGWSNLVREVDKYSMACVI